VAQRKVVFTDRRTGQLLERWVNLGPQRAAPGHGRPMVHGVMLGGGGMQRSALRRADDPARGARS
jgi:hypothetical protein